MADETATTKRKSVSDRGYVDSNGQPVNKIEEATGARYSLLDANGDKTVEFVEQLGPAGSFTTMCAIFGFHTKVGNVANTVLNDKDEPGTPDDAGAAITDFIAGAKDTSDPTWAERGGGVAIRVDKDALARAIVAVAAKSGKTADEAKIRAKLESDKGYMRTARQVPAVATEYAAQVGKAVKSIDDLLG